MVRALPNSNSWQNGARIAKYEFLAVSLPASAREGLLNLLLDFCVDIAYGSGGCPLSIASFFLATSTYISDTSAAFSRLVVL